MPLTNSGILSLPQAALVLLCTVPGTGAGGLNKEEKFSQIFFMCFNKQIRDLEVQIMGPWSIAPIISCLFQAT